MEQFKTQKIVKIFEILRKGYDQKLLQEIRPLFIYCTHDEFVNYRRKRDPKIKQRQYFFEGIITQNFSVHFFIALPLSSRHSRMRRCQPATF
jgi:hypothetical protein